MDSPNTPIDHSHLDDVSGGDRAFEAELMQEFLTSTPSLLADLEAALEAGEVKRVEVVAHTIKGSCRSLGAVFMAEPCETIEHTARTGNLDSCSQHYDQVCAFYQDLCRYIEQTWNITAA